MADANTLVFCALNSAHKHKPKFGPQQHVFTVEFGDQYIFRELIDDPTIEKIVGSLHRASKHRDEALAGVQNG